MRPTRRARTFGLGGAALACMAAFACTSLEDLDAYHQGGSGSAGASGSPGIESGGSSTDDPSDDATDPAPTDTSLDLPVNNPDTAALDAGASAAQTPPDAGESALAACNGSDEVAEGERCYRFASETLSWLAARQACIDWGGRLAVIGSAAEDLSIGQHLLENTWIGLNDIAREGTFEWDGGAGATYRNWAAGEPNDTSTSASNGDCVEKRPGDGSWHDQPCAVARVFSCEKSLP